MKNHWAMDFYNIAQSKGTECEINRRVNGWIETLMFSGKVYFTKSATYDLSRRQFFQGVDPVKLNEHGDFVLFCGGANGTLSHIFIIPWGVFFRTLEKGEAINTYQPPREYFQYKFYIRDREGCWTMSVQGGNRPTLDISKWHYTPVKALESIGSA